MRNYIPSFHLGYSAAEKLTDKWWEEAIQHCYFQSNNVNLLEGKNVKEIDDYASGDFSMRPFKKMFQSVKKKVFDDATQNREDDEDEKNGKSTGYEPLPLLPTRLNSAQSLIERIPIEVTAEAMDALAWEKKEKDVQFLKHKPEFEAQLQELSDKMNLGKVDLGSTKHTAIPFSSSPYGLDLNEADELQVFIDILSGLSVEAALETILQSYWVFKNCDTIKGMWIKDQLRYAVSCHQSFSSSMTGLPDMEYAFPGEFSCPESDYPDFRDNEQRIRTKTMTVIDLFNLFGDEIGSEEDLFELISGDNGYCVSNNLHRQKFENFNSFKVTLECIEVKSIDWVGVVPVNKKSKFLKLTDDEDEVEKNKGHKIWAQNTYCAWWLKNTKKFFGKTKLDYAYRTQGHEYYQGFSTFIMKSGDKSAVELSIPENKKAQRADIKMQHAVIKAKKSGIYIDLKYLRGGLSGLKDTSYDMDELIRLALQENDVIGDTQGFEGKNEGQFAAFKTIPGGLVMSEITGYAQIINDATAKIGQFTGINEQLTGQAANPEGLVGMQKLLINGSTNAISYINRAIENHCTYLFNSWAPHIKDAIEKGGKTKEAIVRLIGSKKVNLIDALDDLPLHQMGIQVLVSQREEERAEFRQEMARLKDKGVLNSVDEYMLSAIKNPKDKWALMAVKEKKFNEKQMREMMDRNEQQQVLLRQQGQNQQQAVQAKVGGDIQKIYAQGDVSSKILQLAAQLGLNEKQAQAMIDKALQQDRGQSQLDKNIRTLEAKQTLENQKPYGA
ncbi:MAG TPA: hypothetical protein VIQ00_07680 [Chitinophagaceae bacterium]